MILEVRKMLLRKVETGGAMARASKGLAMLYFLIWVLVTWLCSFYEDLLRSKFVNFSVCMLEFDSFSFQVSKSRSWVHSISFISKHLFLLLSGLGKTFYFPLNL